MTKLVTINAMYRKRSKPRSQNRHWEDPLPMPSTLIVNEDEEEDDDADEDDDVLQMPSTL